jgi:hypothetical protein
MRYRIRNAQGEELLVPSLSVLHDLYEHGFLADDDLVRSESSSRWVRVRAMPALHGVRERRTDPRTMLVFVAAAVALAAGVAFLFRL